MRLHAFLKEPVGFCPILLVKFSTALSGLVLKSKMALLGFSHLCKDGAQSDYGRKQLGLWEAIMWAWATTSRLALVMGKQTPVRLRSNHQVCSSEAGVPVEMREPVDWVGCLFFHVPKLHCG